MSSNSTSTNHLQISDFVSKTEATVKVKKEIENVFGRRILSNRDCIQLSDAIFERTHFKVNPNTLRRFFGLVKSKYSPSVSTLSILSKFCGFQSFDDIVSVHETDLYSDTIQKESVLNYLYSLFNEIQVHDSSDEAFHTLVRNTIIFLSHNPQLKDEFQRLIAKTPNGQRCYFEQFVHIDELNSFYGNGLRYYLNEQNKDEGDIFAHSLLVFRYWLSMDDEKLEKHYQQVINHPMSESDHPFVSARYLASCLFRAEVFRKATHHFLEDTRAFHGRLKTAKYHNQAFPFFEIIFSEALILTGHYEEGLYYIKYALDVYPHSLKGKDPGFYQSCMLFKAIALYKLGDSKKAVSVFDKIRPSEFNFLSKKYKNILYLNLIGELRGTQAKYKSEIETLLEETGFARLEKIFN